MPRSIVARFLTARARWMAAGKPVRTNEAVADLISICQACPHYRKLTRRSGRCRLCGCLLNVGKGLNKLRWATESCPDNPPRWTAEDSNGNGDNAMTNAEAAPVEESRKEQRRKAREQRRQERARRIATIEAEKRKAKGEDNVEQKRRRRRKREAPPLAVLPENNDPLIMYDRNKQPIGHPVRNWWSPCAGFLVCGGPSLKELDLELLKHRGICSLGVNNVAGLAPVKAFTFSDPPEKFHHGIFFDPGVIKFAPVSKLYKRVRAKKPDGTFGFTSLRVCDCPSVYGYRRDSVWSPGEFLTREAATWGRSAECARKQDKPKILFTFFLGLRLLHYLGVRRVYMIGVDFTMHSGKGYAFPQGRTDGAANGNNSHYRIATEMCRELRPVFDDAGFSVFNCNPESHLDAFDYVPFEQAYADCRSLVPEEPFDLAGWYEKNDGKGTDDRGE